MKLFFYDLETTGVNPGKNGIHQECSIFLSQLLSSDEVEQILTSGNLKLLANKED